MNHIVLYELRLSDNIDTNTYINTKTILIVIVFDQLRCIIIHVMKKLKDIFEKLSYNY